MARGAFSDTYTGLMVLAAPTPKPEMKRPAYMGPRLPDAAACMATPTMMVIAVNTRHGFRPNRSVSGDATSAPTKQPACSTDTMFPERLADASDFGSPRP